MATQDLLIKFQDLFFDPLVNHPMRYFFSQPWTVNQVDFGWPTLLFYFDPSYKAKNKISYTTWPIIQGPNII